MLDCLIVGVYLFGVALVGWWVKKKESNLEEYLLAGRSMPWPLALASLYATAASALTFIGVPGVAYAGDFHYLSLGVGSLLARIFIAQFFLKYYFLWKVHSIYEVLGKKYGRFTQSIGSLIFLGTRLLASGVRLAACGIALGVILEIPVVGAIVLVAVIAMLYTFWGGIRAVMLTDLLQFFLILSGAGLALFYIIQQIEGGIQTIYQIGEAHQKFQFFYGEFNLNDPKTFIAGSLFGFVVTLAGIGCDQDLMQRMLTTKTLSGAKKAMILSGVLDMPVVFLFLSVGASLFAFVQLNPEIAQSVAALKSDMVFPYFIKEVFPIGFKGLLVAGLLSASLSSLDSALGAMASVMSVDLKESSKKLGSFLSLLKPVAWARIWVLVFTVFLVLTAWVFAESDSILWVGFKVVGYTYGPLLALFLMAFFYPTSRELKSKTILGGVLFSMLVAFFSTSLQTTPFGFHFPWDKSQGQTALAWPWGIVLATSSMLILLYFMESKRAGET